MDLKEIFSAVGSKMLLDFDFLHSQIKHLGERGNEREESLKTFLQSYLPTRYSISNGEIVDSDQQVSHQCDLVIFDPTKCPLLLPGGNFRVFPAEPVFGVIEVKSVLTSAELKDAANKIRVIKNLERDNGKIAGIVFAYKSAWKNHAIEQTAEYLQKIYKQFAPYEYIDLICILDSGVIDAYPYSENGQCKNVTAYFDLEVPTLLWFFIRLLDLLDQKPSQSPSYERYINFDEGHRVIGSAKLYTPPGEK